MAVLIVVPAHAHHPAKEMREKHLRAAKMERVSRDAERWDRVRHWRNVRVTTKRQRARELREHRERQRLPYGPCYGGRWAIPCYIIGCESRGHWSALNPSGAAGPYQLMPVHGRPWPVSSAAARAAHHRIAANLWARQGAGPWVCG